MKKSNLENQLLQDNAYVYAISKESANFNANYDAYKAAEEHINKAKLTNCDKFPCGEFECRQGNGWHCAHLNEKSQTDQKPGDLSEIKNEIIEKYSDELFNEKTKSYYKVIDCTVDDFNKVFDKYISN